MSAKLRGQIAVIQEELRELIEFHRELLDTCQTREPAGIELSALAAFLHSLYSGIENLFRRIAIEVDGGLPEGGDWHRRLLRSMAEPHAGRPTVISEELHNRLLAYLEFRHLFRNIYLFRLEWERMADLVLEAEDLVTMLNRELSLFKLPQ